VESKYETIFLKKVHSMALRGLLVTPKGKIGQIKKNPEYVAVIYQMKGILMEIQNIT